MTAENTGAAVKRFPGGLDAELDERSQRIIVSVARGLAPGSAPLATLADLEARSVRLESRFPGGKLVWRRWGDASAPPLVLLHGGGGSWRHWMRNLEALAERHCVWVPDLPGYGDSDLPPDPPSFRSVCDALQAGIEQLLPGDGAFDLVGFSFGSVTASRLTPRFERRVRRLVLVGANFVSNMMGARFEGIVNWRRFSDPLESMAARHNNMRVTMIANAARIDELALYIYASDMLNQRFSPITMTDRSPQSEDIPKIAPGVRLTGISGADDQVFAHIMGAQADSLEQLRPGARFHAIPGASHWVMYEAAEAFNALLLEALAEKLT